MELAAEAGCFVIISLFLLPATIGVIWAIFPQLNVVEAGSLGIFVYALIWIALQKMFGHEPSDD